MVGRFAPSPTGKLHFGSLISAFASYLQVRRAGGRWLVRIEDIDPPREVAGSTNSILRSLNQLDLQSDSEILFQSSRTAVYRETVDTLVRRGKAFWCGCTRKDLPPSGIYPGTCRDGLPAGKSPRAVRLQSAGAVIRFVDDVQGERIETLDETTGDFVIFRADGLPAYQLAVVIDDAFQGVTHVMRGMDLFSSTARQIHLQQVLGLPTPSYAHHPLAVQADESKLGKRFGSVAIEPENAAVLFRDALEFLGQSPPDGLDSAELLEWGARHWKTSRIPATEAIIAPSRYLPR